ncbi:hypothetical protein AB0N28_07050 [Streptomyces sp. NPDC051130]|uniref:hypothetical protein n=1 Tax=Streptomyces sp. NPDC051130 TaxID=3157223 RepID=UPI003445AC3F
MSVHTLATLLPDPAVLLARCRALALLDTILAADAPTYSFFSEWREGVDLARMDNGSGDQYAIVFDPAGVFLYGFDHESDATPWRDRARTGPVSSLVCRRRSRTTRRRRNSSSAGSSTRRCACGVRRPPQPGSTAQSSSPTTRRTEPTGCSAYSPTAPPDAYVSFAEDYLERSIDPDAVTAILTRAPINRQTVTSLSSTADFEAVAVQARVLGFAVHDEPVL